MCAFARACAFVVYGNMYAYVRTYVSLYVRIYPSVHACSGIHLYVSALIFEDVNVLLYFMIYSMALSVGKRLCVRY